MKIVNKEVTSSVSTSIRKVTNCDLLITSVLNTQFSWKSWEELREIFRGWIFRKNFGELLERSVVFFGWGAPNLDVGPPYLVQFDVDCIREKPFFESIYVEFCIQISCFAVFLNFILFLLLYNFFLHLIIDANNSKKKKNQNSSFHVPRTKGNFWHFLSQLLYEQVIGLLFGGDSTKVLLEEECSHLRYIAIWL